jgi:transposase
MLSLPPAVRIFVHREPTDLRRSFDSLAALVTDVLRQDPFSGHLFAFFNRKRDKLKLLVWERGGFWLLYKRLEQGTFAPLAGEAIGARELFCLLEGWDVVRTRARYERPGRGEAVHGAPVY